MSSSMQFLLFEKRLALPVCCMAKYITAKGLKTLHPEAKYSDGL